jgi:hypothetical protein
MKIMIIDDDLEFAKRLQARLVGQGHDVLVYTQTNNEAFDTLHTMGRFKEFRPEITFCDPRRLRQATFDYWMFVEHHDKLPKKIQSRLVIMANVDEEAADKQIKPRARAFLAEFVTKVYLLNHLEEVIEQGRNTP